ncbi:sulfotransferase [Psychroserpens burtonensis]|uniref:Sulfotransferase n=1 Tax=Psychroserpens burtonensis TaxID=49278 RepID=A0A5C7BC79_9FLAO|nr:sulfotransferase [Psychroserpens burtonensis]TXE18893.1 sulfotransferase [Psychroserpens burtonensis]
MKVNFLIIGSAKSATTSLSNGLALHPDICFSNPKEPQFFSKIDWRHHISEYHALFTSKAKLYGEGSTNYTKHPSFNKNIYTDIFEYNPEMKLIYIMRHPIDRIVSHYTHTYNRGYEQLQDINEAISQNEHYINTSQYATQITPYIEQFGRDRVLLLFFEDFITKPQEVLNTVYRFLDIDQLDIDISSINSNKSFNRRVLHYTYDNPKTIWEKFKKVGLIIKNYFNRDFIDSKPQLTQATKKHIINSVADDIRAIEKLTNRNLSKWLKL